MLPNAHNLNHQIPEKAQVVKPKLTIALMLVSLFGLGVVILTFQVHATENTTMKLNLYAEKYVEQNGRNLKSLSLNPDTQLELSKNQEEDNTRMLEKGYDMMGSSTFVAPNTSSELAQQYGKAIKADTVLVYNKSVPIRTKIVRLDGDQEGAKIADETNNLTAQTSQTIHYASYWAKLPTPLFGVHIIKLIPSENKGLAKVAEVKGLTIIAVIEESPAAKASILKGDNLLKIGEMVLDKPDDLFAAVKRYAGQTVSVELQRGEAVVKAIVTLNQRI